LSAGDGPLVDQVAGERSDRAPHEALTLRCCGEEEVDAGVAGVGSVSSWNSIRHTCSPPATIANAHPSKVASALCRSAISSGGLRQGEALGLKWDDIDLDKATIRIRRGRLRPQYEHGCGGTCGRKPGHCPQRRNTRPTTGQVKSRAGRRTIGLPPPLVARLRKHRADQEAERVAARQLWSEEGWVFATRTGGPINPNTDYHEWKDLLKAAGLREARLDDARHTAAPCC
jgi:integrase